MSDERVFRKCEACGWKLVELNGSFYGKNYYCEFCVDFVVCTNCLQTFTHEKLIDFHLNNCHNSVDIV